MKYSTFMSLYRNAVKRFQNFHTTLFYPTSVVSLLQQIKFPILSIIFCLLFPSLIHAQAGYTAINNDTTGKWHAAIELQAVATSQNHIPFWMRTNQFGSIPLSGISGGLLASAKRDYKREEKQRLLDWGIGISGRVNAGNTSEALLTEAYIKGRLSIVQLKAGQSKDISGLADSSLSSGAFAVSGNALGIPKIELSIPEYWYLPFTGKIIALKGNFAHGWFGETPLDYTQGDSSVHSYYHQKSLYGRLGRPGWRFKLYAGFNHQVMWGNEKRMEPRWGLSSTETFWYVASGKAYGGRGIPVSKVGNHLGSVDQGLEYDFNTINISGYHQFFYDVGGLYHGNNLRDGLFGIVIKNKKQPGKNTFTWTKLLVEYLASKSQGGEWDAPVTPSGDEDYYNNPAYKQGWTYKEENIGNNFFTQKKYARAGQVMRDNETIINNRVKLLHIGAEGFAGKWYWQTKLSFSNNYGTYRTSPEGSSMGNIRYIYPPPYFKKVSQFSGYIEASRVLRKNYYIGFALAADQGRLLDNSVGGVVKVGRVW